MTVGVAPKTVWRYAVILTVLVSVFGCVSAPVQEMSNARQAIAAAQDAGAANTAPDVLEKAQRLLSMAEQRLQRKEFREARRAAVAAKLQAIRALQTTDGTPDPG
ncbi:MAG: DUF4398 domain-containing protein [Gammaproteobacteria bacterium]|nr:DUF4398 domain-containing protein [Gammaproteobacteria bacterium]MDH3767524.1 DUF4398 domain-containing protein [Gammaproteobacteria bacterium]